MSELVDRDLLGNATVPSRPILTRLRTATATLGASLIALAICGAALGAARAQVARTSRTVLEDDTLLARALPPLAEQVLEQYQEADPRTYLGNVFKAQLVAGRYAEAIASIRRLRVLLSTEEPTRDTTANLQFEIFALAKVREAAEHSSFEQAFRSVFRETVRSLDAKEASDVIRSFGSTLASFEEDLIKSVASHRDGRAFVDTRDAVDLVTKYALVGAYQSFRPLSADLIAEDDDRRYVIDNDATIRAADGAELHAIVVRPRIPARPLPTLFTLTIYAGTINFGEARRNAAHGYAAVVAYSRGKGGSPDAVAPYEHDAEDGVAVIEWIARQPWSDGRVGMYGGSYSGYTAWSAARRRPPALKALMASVPAVPGFDVPMEGNVFQGFVYSWPLYTASGPWLNDALYQDRDRWKQLFRRWYESGQAFRSLDELDGIPNPIFHRWLDHPDYDAYWQSMAPTAMDFRRLSIPILETGGLLEGQSLTAPYYLSEHLRQRPDAEHYLVLGPYDHFGAQGRPADVVAGYRIDPAAWINIRQLRFDWFDYVLKGGKRPALLADHVNYEVMGANQWKHAPSLAAMSNGTLRLFLSQTRSGNVYELVASADRERSGIPQRVDLANRSDAGRPFPESTLDRILDSANGVVFESAPLETPRELSGQFGGVLEFITNKQDFDLNVGLYEQLASGEYLTLSYYLIRASYAQDLGRRQLLIPGQLQRLPFRTGHVMSRQMPAGSRIVLVLNVIKETDSPINYGSGKNVYDETIADATMTLAIEWLSSSYVELPIVL